MKYIDNQFFLNCNYCKFLTKANPIAFSSGAVYSKGWFSNKAVIVGANGVITLSVPLLGGRNQKSLIKDVKIAYTENWRQQHLRSVRSCYGNAPYFDYYYPILQKIYNQKIDLLFDLNLLILKEVLQILKIDTTIVVSTDQVPAQDILFTKVNFLNNPEHYIDPIKYPQVFEDRLGFIPNLSIIDLIMCMGPQAKTLLETV